MKTLGKLASSFALALPMVALALPGVAAAQEQPVPQQPAEAQPAQPTAPYVSPWGGGPYYAGPWVHARSYAWGAPHVWVHNAWIGGPRSRFGGPAASVTTVTDRASWRRRTSAPGRATWLLRMSA